MPPHLAAHALQAGAASFAFSRGERQAMRRRRQIPISEWTERHRVVRMSSIPGKWHNIFTPYLTGIMDAAGFASVQTVILCKTPQTGGSEAGHNIIGYAIDRAPGPAMYVFPDENTASENARDRIIPMIEDSRRLREYLTGHGNDLASVRINMANMPIYLGWSGSVARLGNKPIRYLILDELDKYKNVKNEATSEALAEKRTTTWGRRRLIFKISTPTTENGPIWRAFTEEANCRFDYWVRCPHCGHMQLMRFDRIVWTEKHKRKLIAKITGEVHEDELPEETINPEDILANKTAEYCCENLGCLWDDGDRDRAARAGEWRERATGLELSAHLKTYQPLKVGFHLPAWLSFFVSLSEVAHAFLKYQRSGKLDDLKNFTTQYEALPWKEQYEERAESAILALCDTRPRGVVPTPHEHPDPVRRLHVAAILASVDTQHRYLRYAIRAFPYQSRESWLIQAGTAPDFAALDQILWESEYWTGPDQTGTPYRVRNAIIDAMGTRTSEVYRYCAKHRGRMIPYQGVQRQATPISHTAIEFLTDDKGNKIKIPGGVLLHRVDTTFFKGDLASLLTIAPGDPGAFNLHSNGNGELNTYAREMCAEAWSDEEQAWINPHQRDNHFWDCEVMMLALAYQLGIRNWKLPEQETAQQRQTAPPKRRGKSAADRLGNLRR